MATNSKFRWGRWLFFILILAAFLGGTVWYLKRPRDEAPQFLTGNIIKGDLTQVVTATGQLNPVVNVQVGSQISGNIQKLFADFNSKVSEGQVIAQLDPATFNATVMQSEGDLANAKAALELAEVDARRAEELYKNKLISQADHDKAQADLHQAEATVQIKKANLERAKVDLARCTIFSPIEGIVISRNVDVGQTVAASMSAPVLFVIAKDLTQMQIDANVSEADVGGVEEGQDVTFTVDAFPSRTFTGKVIQIRNAPITVQNVVSYDTVIEVSNPDMKLKPGMTANVSIITAQRASCLKIPNSALRFKPPEPSTNKTLFAELMIKMGLSKPDPASTNKPVMVASAPESTGGGGGGFGGGEGGGGKGKGGPGGGGGKGKGGPGGGGGGGKGGKSGRQSNNRTVYVLGKAETTPSGEPLAPKPQSLQIKVGISDGIFTEVTDGATEGTSVITGVSLPQAPAAAAAAPPGSSPFGGGPRFGR